MSCRYKDQCPSYDEWCVGPKQDFSSCVSFLISAYENEKNKKTFFDLVQKYPYIKIEIQDAGPIEGFVVRVRNSNLGQHFEIVYSKYELMRLSIGKEELEHVLVQRIIELFNLEKEEG